MQGCAATNLTGAVFFLDFCTVLRQRLTGRLPNTSDTQVTQDHCFSINATQDNTTHLTQTWKAHICQTSFLSEKNYSLKHPWLVSKQQNRIFFNTYFQFLSWGSFTLPQIERSFRAMFCLLPSPSPAPCQLPLQPRAPAFYNFSISS